MIWFVIDWLVMGEWNSGNLRLSYLQYSLQSQSTVICKHEKVFRLIDYSNFSFLFYSNLTILFWNNKSQNQICDLTYNSLIFVIKNLYSSFSTWLTNWLKVSLHSWLLWPMVRWTLRCQTTSGAVCNWNFLPDRLGSKQY